MTVGSLKLFERSLFTAHELAQMVPLYSLDVYYDFLRVNDWAKGFLPNAFGTNAAMNQTRPVAGPGPLKRVGERLLSGRLGDTWEHHESQTKIRQLRVQAEELGSSSARFTPQMCKGHLTDHGRIIEQLYAQRKHTPSNSDT